ncbi:membrane dipeptidase GliJ [Apiospora arundinis]|uniref:gamma-glutamylcyclotransferase n=1 Tax=Apiospora arundinis TaxID=335852 RepID=A0ABR2I2S7_9PEZI
MATHDSKDEVWYFAYGSNMRSSVLEGRGIRPLANRRAVIPSYVLTFDVFGVPYSEPAMASIALRHSAATARCTGKEAPPPVNGVAYLLSSQDFRTLVLSEGAGVAYTEVQLEAYSADGAVPTASAAAEKHDTHHSQGDAAGVSFPVRTLVARFPLRPNPMPSARYLSLLIDGAKEHQLPAEYQAHLEGLPSYHRQVGVSRRRDLGAQLFLGFWMPLLSWVMRRIKAASAKGSSTGHAPPYAGYVVAVLFNVMWCYHDWVHCHIWGQSGGR